MSKSRLFSTTGVTNPLVDARIRPFTMVAVLTETPRKEVNRRTKSEVVGNKVITTLTQEMETYTEYTLSLGVAFLSPKDEDIAEKNAGIEIAKGKALKQRSALATITTRTKGLFTKSFIEDLLARESEKVTKNPNKYVKVSIPRDTVLAPLVKKINQRSSAKAANPVGSEATTAPEAVTV